MKKAHILSLLFISAAFILSGCGDSAETLINWDGDKAGTLEIFNGSSKDMVLFSGQVPNRNSVIGGVRAGATRKFDPSKHVDDFSVGGYMVIRGISRDEFNANELNLEAAKIEYSAMATYGAGKSYRITIDLTYTGDYGFKVTNKGRIGMELRKNSPEGEKVAYLPRLQVNQVVYTQTTDAITLFPVYVFFNNLTGEVNTLYATSMFESVMATPRPLTNPSGVQTYGFPNDDGLSWEQIVGTLKAPVAYITVTNNVMGQGAYFTNAGSTTLYSQNGYDAIGSGEQLMFEIAGSEEGVERFLVVKLYNGVVMVPVRVEGQDTYPIIKNGYEYAVTVRGSGQDPSAYTAFITEGKKRDLSDQLISQ
ncbi:MAG: hypothetical protein FWB90_01650 [Fibromonadales bacterium]|nr:hypothetical protein [Fibromonadales bacterium]